MPARTNDFQRLVALVERAFAGKDAKITESAMVIAPGFGSLREIDVLVETKAGQHALKIAVEAKDHGRPLNQVEVGAIIAKYRSPGGLTHISNVVIVTANGYSKDAKRLAALNGVEALTLSRLKPEDIAATLFKPSRAILRHAGRPYVTNVRILFAKSLKFNPQEVPHGRLICRCHGNDHGTPYQWAQHLLQKHLLRNASFMTKLHKAGAQHDNVCAKFDCGMPNFVFRLAGPDYDIERLSFHVHTSMERVDVPLENYQMSGDDSPEKMIQHGTAELGGMKFEMLMAHEPHAKKFTINFGPCDAPKKY